MSRKRRCGHRDAAVSVKQDLPEPWQEPADNMPDGPELDMDMERLKAFVDQVRDRPDPKDWDNLVKCFDCAADEVASLTEGNERLRKERRRLVAEVKKLQTLLYDTRGTDAPEVK